MEDRGGILDEFAMKDEADAVRTCASIVRGDNSISDVFNGGSVESDVGWKTTGFTLTGEIDVWAGGTGFLSPDGPPEFLRDGSEVLHIVCWVLEAEVVGFGA